MRPKRELPLFLICLLVSSCGVRNPSLTTLSPSPSTSPTSVYASGEDCSPVGLSDGAIRGRLCLKNGEPATGSILYLSKYAGPEETPLVVLNSAVDLHTETGAGGVFCFRQVASGRYALIVWNAVDSILLDDPASGYSLAIEVEPSKVADVGILYTPVP